jgi:hypothetical protein
MCFGVRAAEAARIWLATTAKLNESDDEDGDVDDEVGSVHGLCRPFSSGITQEVRSPSSALHRDMAHFVLNRCPAPGRRKTLTALSASPQNPNPPTTLP